MITKASEIVACPFCMLESKNSKALKTHIDNIHRQTYEEDHCENDIFVHYQSFILHSYRCLQMHMFVSFYNFILFLSSANSDALSL